MDRSANYEAKKIHISNLMRMVDFCENISECRRAQVLAYFAETFSEKACKAIPTTACDNCLKSDSFKVLFLYNTILLIENIFDIFNFCRWWMLLKNVV